MKPIPFFLLFAFAPALDCPAAEATRPADPNVVLILTDDLGWQDVKCYDIDDPSPYETPNMDALARHIPRPRPALPPGARS